MLLRKLVPFTSNNLVLNFGPLFGSGAIGIVDEDVVTVTLHKPQGAEEGSGPPELIFGRSKIKIARRAGSCMHA